MTSVFDRIQNSGVYRKARSVMSKVPPPLWGMLLLGVLIYAMIVFAQTPVSQSPHIYVDSPAPLPKADSAVVMANKIETAQSPFGNTLEETKINQYYPAHPVSSEIRHRLRNVVPAKV